MRGRRRRGVVMFWGERGEDLGRIGKKEWKRERKEKRKMNKKGVIVGCFFVMNLGVFFWKEGLRRDRGGWRDCHR